MIKRKNTVKSFVFFAMLLSLSIAACKKSEDTTPAATTTTTTSNAVSIQNNAFNSNAITVAVNTTVTWTNKDGFAHTVTSNTGLFDSNQIASGGTYTHQFTSAGSFPYHCSNHSAMTGTVTIK